MASCDPPYQPNGPGLGSQNKVSAEQPTQFKRFYAAAHPLPLISEIVAKKSGPTNIEKPSGSVLKMQLRAWKVKTEAELGI